MFSHWAWEKLYQMESYLSSSRVENLSPRMESHEVCWERDTTYLCAESAEYERRVRKMHGRDVDDVGQPT